MNKVTNFIFKLIKEDSKVKEILKSTEFFDEEQIINYQNDKLKKLIVHSYNNVPYYHDLFNSLHISPSDIKSKVDLNRLPILTKEIIRREQNRIFDNTFKNYYSSTTSGTTGSPIFMRRNKESKIIENELFSRFNRNIGFSLGDDSINIWGRVYPSPIKKIVEKMKLFLLNTSFYNTYELDYNVISKIIKEIQQNPNVHIRAFTSALFWVAQEMKNRGIVVNVNSMSVSVEQLFEEQRRLISQSLGNNLFDQYGCGEVQSIAFECNYHTGLHHAFEHSILEVLDDNNYNCNEGRVILTNLDNMAMPLIRYENGDLVKLSDQKCPCGRSGIIIKKVMGRQFDHLVGTNGNIIHGAYIDDVILRDDILENCKILQFRLVQIFANIIRLDYVSNSEISKEYRMKIIMLLQKKLGDDMIINFNKKEKLLLSANGKRRLVVSLEEYNKNRHIYK
jgi:phenylacetate-CoA ligase